jgi:hypothetical protein
MLPLNLLDLENLLEGQIRTVGYPFPERLAPIPKQVAGDQLEFGRLLGEARV